MTPRRDNLMFLEILNCKYQLCKNCTVIHVPSPKENTHTPKKKERKRKQKTKTQKLGSI